MNTGCTGCEYNEGVNKCSIGLVEESTLWWKNNGEKYSKDNNFDEMSCYKETHLTGLANQVSECLENIKDIVIIDKLKNLLTQKKENLVRYEKNKNNAKNEYNEAVCQGQIDEVESTIFDLEILIKESK